MSGGYFDYQEYHINNIIESIEDLIEKNYIQKEKKDLSPWDYDDETGQIREDCKYYYTYSPETINVFKQAINALKMAYIYAHRIDYLREGDDDEDSFHKRLKQELKELEDNKYVF